MELTIAKTESLPPARSLWAEVWYRFRKNRLAVVCLGVFAFYVVLALAVAFGLIAGNWDQTVAKPYSPPSWQNPFGTDIFGQSVLRKTIYSAKTSLTVAFLASLISIGIGLPLGAIAGYFGKWIDEIVVWIYSTLESVPYILLILAFAFVLQNKVLFAGTGHAIPLSGITAVYLAIGLTSWVGLCRLIRGEVIKHKNRDYVMAAKAFGASDLYIIFRHIVPNVFHLVIIDFSLRFVGFIQAEVTLSFLGLGAKEQPSWGVMIDDARLELGRGVWWQMVAATVAIFIISLALNIVGDALRDSLDPKLRGR
ncbi:MAG: ABC transporter permease [Phycisphaerae bacterium]